MCFHSDIKCTLFSDVFITNTKFGHPLMLIGNHRYYKNNRSHGSKATWFCYKNRYHCRASVITYDDVIIQVRNEHNH